MDAGCALLILRHLHRSVSYIVNLIAYAEDNKNLKSLALHISGLAEVS